MSQFFSCRCTHSKNIFIKKYKQHFTYEDEPQFWKDYGNVLKSLGCKTAEDKELLLFEIKNEVQRRKQIEDESLRRISVIKENYIPCYPDVFHIQEEFMESSFLRLAEISHEATVSNEICPFLDVISEDKRLYGFPLFTSEFCHLLLKELDHFEHSSLPKGRPNTMNNYGTLLEEIGFYPDFIDVLRVKYLNSICRLLYPEWCGARLNSQRGFVVKYSSDKDLDLDYHYDNAEVTLNVCLGKSFTGSEIYFGDMKDICLSNSTCILVNHKIGYCILHRGQQMHGALPIISGERVNMILWMRSSDIRNFRCPMCDDIPKLMKSVGYGDGFTNSAENDCSRNKCTVM